MVNKNTEFFTTESPENILDELLGYCDEKGYKCQAAEDKYKVKIEVLNEQQSPVDMCVNIMKAAPEKYCVEF